MQNSNLLCRDDILDLVLVLSVRTQDTKYTLSEGVMSGGVLLG